MAARVIDRKQDQFIRKENFHLWIALKHHRTHKNKPLDFRQHEYAKRIYADKNPYIVVIKSTQCGLTEYLLSRAMSKAIMGQSVFYVLPTYTLVNRFVRNRIDKSIKHTRYYKTLEAVAREEDSKRAESMTLKDIGAGNIAFVGSNSTAAFVEYPADELIIDELDECDQDNIVMAWERLSASEHQTQVKVANPTIEGFGIDQEYSGTDQKEWFVKHTCGKYIKLDWFKHFVRKEGNNLYSIQDAQWDWESGRDLYGICHYCHKPIENRRAEGIWVPKKESRSSGYRVTKLFSGNVSIVELMKRFNDGLANDTKLQRFYNADLGQAFTAEGAKITESMILGCAGDHAQGAADGLNIIGIDVGSFYNYVIATIIPDNKIKVIKIGKEKETQQIINIMNEYNVRAGIIDGLPETREARKIANSRPLMFLCYFGNVKNDMTDFAHKTVTVQRTPALDAVKESILTKAIVYPHNISGEREYIEHMTASVRRLNTDRKSRGGVSFYEWVEGSRADHYFLATGYCLIARRLISLIAKR